LHGFVRVEHSLITSAVYFMRKKQRGLKILIFMIEKLCGYFYWEVSVKFTGTSDLHKGKV